MGQIPGRRGAALVLQEGYSPEYVSKLYFCLRIYFSDKSNSDKPHSVHSRQPQLVEHVKAFALLHE